MTTSSSTRLLMQAAANGLLKVLVSRECALARPGDPEPAATPAAEMGAPRRPREVVAVVEFPLPKPLPVVQLMGEECRTFQTLVQEMSSVEALTSWPRLAYLIHLAWLQDHHHPAY